jgi:predicted RNA-binding protein with PUA domain
MEMQIATAGVDAVIESKNGLVIEIRIHVHDPRGTAEVVIEDILQLARDIAEGDDLQLVAENDDFEAFVIYDDSDTVEVNAEDFLALGNRR